VVSLFLMLERVALVMRVLVFGWDGILYLYCSMPWRFGVCFGRGDCCYG
jgi:hypothetical protein